MRKLIGIVGLAAAALLAGCGGGGGSPGTTHQQYQITLRASKTELPLNISHQPASIGAYAPYTTTLYVNATAGGQPIANGKDDVFGCHVDGGLDSGSLYYLDGNKEHEDDNGNPKAYRDITLGANSGGASFHFHAGDKAGVSRITCTVTDPRDSSRYSASVDITVGGTATVGMPASVVFRALAPGYLGSQFNPNDIRNNVSLQATVMDDANQPVPNPKAANVRVRILPIGAAATGARLLLGNQSGDVVQAQTQGGIALFSLSSGPSRGTILLELTVDRRDNDVTNALQDPITQLLAVPVVDGISAQPLALAPISLEIPGGVPFAQALEATGGTLPYSWTALEALPSGLTLAPSGVVSGTPRVRPGTYVVRVRVMDAFGVAKEAALTIKITGQAVELAAASITGTVGTPLSYVLSATGGVQPYSWQALGSLPPGLGMSSGGVISGTPTTAGSYSLAVRVSDSGDSSAVGNITIEIASTAGGGGGTPTVPALKVNAATLTTASGVAYSYALTATGGVPGYTWSALGSLPAGLTMAPNGVISGTATTAGSYAVAVLVTDSAGSTASANITITVSGTAIPPITIDTADLVATVGLDYSYALRASGGIAPYTWAPLGSLPPGLAMDSAGIVSGRPTTPGTYAVAVKVTDSNGGSISGNITIKVTGPLVVGPGTSTPVNVQAQVGIPFSYSLTASGGSSPYTWTLHSSNPVVGPWLTLTQTGLLSGTPPAGSAGTYEITVLVEDTDGTSALGRVNLTVVP